MMLRSRPAHKGQSCRDPLMPEWSPDPRCVCPDALYRLRNAPFFSLSGLLVGFGRGVADSGSARSPRSPLDCRVFSCFGGHLVRSPRSPGGDGRRKSWWDCDRVGLGLIDSLSDGAKPRGRVLGSSQMRITIPSPRARHGFLLAEGSATSPKSLPKNYVISSHARIESPYTQLGSTQMEPGELGKIQSLSSNVARSEHAQLGSSPLVGGTKLGAFSGSLPVTGGFMDSLCAGDIEQSEDYTCIVSHGPNPRTTHMFGDCILERHAGDVFDLGGNEHGEGGRRPLWVVRRSEYAMPPPADHDFLRLCFSCKKKLDGKDIYMYRGEKAFCSCSCRSQEILVEGEVEEPAMEPPGTTGASCSREIFLPGGVVTT